MGVIRTKVVEIRKARKCFGCLDMIESGYTANVQTITDSGSIYDITICDECNDYIQRHFGPDDEYYEGELKELREEEELEGL